MHLSTPCPRNYTEVGNKKITPKYQNFMHKSHMKNKAKRY